MKINKELRRVFANEHSLIKSVKVEYSNGDNISGFIKEVNFEGLNVTLCQHEVARGENPYHKLNFEEAVEVKLIFEDETEKVFN